MFIEGRDEATLARTAQAPPLERMGTPEDIAEVVAFSRAPLATGSMGKGSAPTEESGKPAPRRLGACLPGPWARLPRSPSWLPCPAGALDHFACACARALRVAAAFRADADRWAGV